MAHLRWGSLVIQQSITSKPLTFSDSFHPAAGLEILVFSQKEIKVALSNTNFPFVSAQFNILSSTQPITIVMSFFYIYSVSFSFGC